MGMRPKALDRRHFLKSSVQCAAAGLCASSLGLSAQASSGDSTKPHGSSRGLPKELSASNFQELGTLVPQGLAALLKQYPSLRFPIEPSKALPSTSPRAMLASFAGSNALIRSQTNPALAKMQGHLFRPRPVNLYRQGRAYPVRADGGFYEIRYWSHRVGASALSNAPSALWFAVKGGYLAPSSLRGDALLVHEYQPQPETAGEMTNTGQAEQAAPRDQAAQVAPADTLDTARRQAWIYQSGSRRVRRAPDLAYDAVSDGSEGMMTADQVDGFNGATDRYDWIDLGETERLIAYNMLEGVQASLSANELLGRGSLKSSAFRLERHAVHQIEARLRPGQQHIYARRLFLIDAATKTIVMEEAFDARGGLWRVALHGLAFHEALGCVQTRVSVYHDLLSGGYVVTGLDPESGPVFETQRPARWNDFQPDALRRLGR